MASVAALLAALDLQLTPDGVTLVALQWVWLELWLDHQQTSGEAALVALVLGNHWQAICWAALVTLVAPVAAPLAALGLQQTPAGVALVCRLKHRLQHKLKYSQEHWQRHHNDIQAQLQVAIFHAIVHYQLR